MAIKYQVGPLRAAGLEAKWAKTDTGAPIIVARWPGATQLHQRAKWHYVDASMFRSMQQDGIVEAYDGHTMLSDIFGIPLNRSFKHAGQ